MKNFEHAFFDKVFNLKTISSTSKKAESFIKNREADGNFLVTAISQKTGVGRKGVTWHSPEGGIWMTAGLYNLQVEVNLTLFVGIIIHKAILKLFPQFENELKIKWPNDLYIKDKKMCGIITNFLPTYKYHLIGIGIDSNISEFPYQLEEIATSLLIETSENINNEYLSTEIFNIFAFELPTFIDKGLKEFYQYFEKYSYLTNKNIILDTEFKKFHGKVKGINSKGALLLQINENMIQPFYSGSVIQVEK